MTEANTLILNNAAATLNAASAALQVGKDEVTKLDAQKLELERQVRYHNQQGNVNDATIVSVQLNNTYSLLDAAQKKVISLQAAYDSAYLAYQNAQKLLTPEEKEEIKILAQTNATIAAAEATAKGVTAEAQASALKSEFFAKNVKYIVLGVIVLVIAIGVLIYIKRKKKVA